jgi:hypothetical protein
VRDTGLVLEPANSGKPRLRSQLDDRFQIGRMVAAMCLLPDPRRGYDGAGADLPTVIAKRYVLSRLGFGSETEFSAAVDMVTIDPTFINLEDAGEVVVSIGIASRWDRVAAIYQAIPAMPPLLGAALAQHRDYMASGQTVTKALTTIVTQLGKAVAQVHGPHAPGHDPLPALERLLGIEAPEGPTLPAPDKLGEDEPEVSARSAVQYRLAKARGPGARQFSVAVRHAYQHRCGFCGLMFGGVHGISPGVDAAHILAWSKHDLDVVSNGISLCKLHHWAFDAALLLPQWISDGTYALRLTTLAEHFPHETRQRLVASNGMVLPADWLPTETAMRPSKTYLQRLQADLAVVWAA